MAVGGTAAAIMMGATMVNSGMGVLSASPERAAAEPAKRARKVIETSASSETLSSAMHTLSLGGSVLRSKGMLEFDSGEVADEILVAWKERLPKDAMSGWAGLSLNRTRALSAAEKEKRLAFWKAALRDGERARELAKEEPDPSQMLQLAEAAFESGDEAKTAEYGKLALAKLPRKEMWYSGNVIHDVHCWLGRIALRHDDTAGAVGHLKEAGKTPGSPQLNSFGPDFTLARELASAGERDAVIAYLEEVGRFWKMEDGNLQRWIGALRDGSVPSFRKYASSVEDRKKMVGQKAPGIRATTINGDGWDLESLRGKIVLVEFWATWCAPCRKQMPALSAFYKAHASEGFEMIGLSSGEDEEVVKTFLGQHPVSYPIAIAPPNIVRAYGAHSLPSAFWVTKDGTIAAVDVGAGPDTERELQSRWQQMISGKPIVPAQPPTIAARTYRVGGSVSTPMLLHKTEPEYSDEARRAGINATVLLGLIVGSDGVPKNFSTIRGAGFGLDEQAIASVKQWRFKPAIRQGVPVDVQSTIEVSFRMLKVSDKARLTFDMPAGATRPVLLYGKVPSLPESYTGTWTAVFSIDDEGKVSEVESDAPQGLRKQIETWRFSKSTLGGTPIRVKGKLELSH
jgi:TonB family protein